ncbi:MAG: hypothetical protein C0603_06090 [Denitrovibrio sp.]|nr:MAG: hypothetical protein C0603_06090 [Denitrovibrio sp.]
MFYSFDRNIDISDYNGKGEFRIDSILKVFQEAAITHSASIGFTTESYMGAGNIWMHNKNLFKVDSLPDFKQKLTVKTWSRGMEKFRGIRNYEVYADGKKCITGSSIWIYLNIAKRRPIRPSDEMVAVYDSENVPVFDDMIKTIKHVEPSNDITEKLITLRPSDIDVNGHVSNVVYGQFIETALSEYNIDITNRFVSLSYMHEIKPDVQEVSVKTEKVGNSYKLGIYSGEECACLAEVSDV